MFKLNQRVLYSDFDFKRYSSRNQKVKPYGIIKQIRKSTFTGGFIARIHVGDGLILSFDFEELKPYIINSPDEV